MHNNVNNIIMHNRFTFQLSTYNNIIIGTQLFTYNTFSSQSPHNKAVMAKLVEELTKNPDNTFPVGTVSCKLVLQIFILGL